MAILSFFSFYLGFQKGFCIFLSLTLKIILVNMSEMVWIFLSWTHLPECQNACLNHPGGVKAQLWGIEMQLKLYQSRTTE